MHNKNISFSLFIKILVLLVPMSTIQANGFSQPGFYNVHHYVLGNGLRVILKPRHLAPNVSIRLNVNVGQEHFSCGKRETAHFLEHLLFTGTSKHDENELDDLIESHGGSWNAVTGNDYTQYKIDIYNKYLDVGMNVLHEIITDSLISVEDVERSRKIINREAGGKPSALRNWLYKNGLIVSSTHLAVKDLLPNGRNLCNEIDNSSSVTREEIVLTRDNYYVPNNMTLSIVGDFDLAVAKTLISKTLGLMKPVDGRGRVTIPVPDVNDHLDSSRIYTGKFYPLIGTDATVYQLYRIPDKHHTDKLTFDVLEEYFNREMYRLLRVEKGLAYSPGAQSVTYDKFGLFLLSSDSAIDHVDTNLKLMSEIVEKFKRGDLDKDVLKETKLKILLSAARGYETNRDFSAYYAQADFEIKEHGALLNYEAGIDKVSLDDIKRVSLKYLTSDNRVIAVATPTFTYTQFYILIIIVLIVVALVIWRFVLHIRGKRNKRQPNIFS